MPPTNGNNSRKSNGNPLPPEAPPFLRNIERARIVSLDVRPLFEKGEEPLAAILRAADRVENGEILQLTVPFEPVPLFGVLARKGFSKWSQPPENPEESWTIYFYREHEQRPEETEAPATEAEEDEGVDEIDVRGLEPPQPMERVLEALEEIGYGRVLLVRHHREPLILYDVLAERGFAHRGKQLAEDEWEIRIWRKT